MKKFSKVFTALLIATLLVSALSVMSFAVTKTGSDRLNVTDDPYNIYNDFSEKKKGHNTSWGGDTVSDVSTHDVGVFISSSNGYFRIYGSGGQTRSASEVGRYWGTSFNGNVGAGNYKSNLFETSYSVVDFEFGTDRYTFTYTADVVRKVDLSGSKVTPGVTTEDLGNITMHKTVSSITEFERYVANPALLEGTFSTTTKYSSQFLAVQTDTVSNVVIDVDSLHLAFADGHRLASNFIYATSMTASGKGSRDDKLVYNAFIVHDDDYNYYLSVDNKYSEDDVRLVNKVGQTDHISIVFDNGVLNSGYISYTIYVNGEYFTSTKLIGKKHYNASTLVYGAMRGIGFTLNGNTKNLDCYSIMMDNVAMNWYRTNPSVGTMNTESWSAYDSGEKYGVDDLIADLNNGIYNPLYMCEDVLYTGEYYSPNGALVVDGTYSSIPGTFGDFLANIKDGSVVSTDLDIKKLEIPEGVESFTLKYDKTITNVTFSDNFGEKYVCIPQGDGLTYLIRTIQDSDCFDLKYAIDGAVIKTLRLPFATDPALDISFMKLDVAALKLSAGVISSWKIDIDGWYENAPLINLYEEEDLRALTLNEVNLVKEEFGELVAKASTDEAEAQDVELSDYAYIAGRVVDGILYVLTDSNGGFDQYKDLATLEAESAAWSDDVVCYTVAEGTVSEFDWNADTSSGDNGAAPVALWHGKGMNGSVSAVRFN